MRPKFDECRTCWFFSKKFTNPICRECGNGEFYEEKQSSRPPNDHELMKLFGKMHNDNDS